MPASDTARGCDSAPRVTSSCAGRVPYAVGVKPRSTAQLASAATGLAQLPRPVVYSAECVPLTAAEPTASGLRPLLVRVTGAAVVVLGLLCGATGSGDTLTATWGTSLAQRSAAVTGAPPQVPLSSA